MGHIEADIAMISWADEVWLVGEYGRDCQWELGYATGIRKPIKVFRYQNNRLFALWRLSLLVLNQTVPPTASGLPSGP